MKSLRHFIIEALSTSPKSISIDFADLEDGKDNKESLKELLDEKEIQYTESGEQISFNIDPNNLDKAKDIYDQLKSYSNTLRTSMKRTNNEQYAQKTLTFEQEVEEINAYIEEINQSTEAEKQAEQEKAEKEKEEQEKAEQEKAKQMNTNVNNKLKVKNQKKKKEEE